MNLMPLQHITVYQMLSIKVDYTMFSSARLSNFGSAASVLRISYFPNLPQHSVTLEKLLMMKLHVVTSSILLAIISALAVNGQKCGGVLEGDNGEFQHSPSSVGSPGRCIWLVRAYAASKIQVTLTEFTNEDSGKLILYPENLSGDLDLEPIELSTEAVGSTMYLNGSVAIIILPRADSTVSFEWDSIPGEILTSDSVTTASYIESPGGGKLTWRPRRIQERLLWIIDLEDMASEAVDYTTKADTSDCDPSHPCTCLSFQAFELNNEGYLVEVSRVCGMSATGSFGLQSYPLLVVASANTTIHGASEVRLNWVKSEGPPVTTTPATPPPESEGSIYFATWEGGLQAYSLATSDLNTVVNNSLSLYGVAFDSATDNIYWCSSTDIFRGNRNGTASETLTPSLPETQMTDLTFDWITGNLYVVTATGYIYACDTWTTGSLTCVALLTGQGDVEGLALNPIDGTMFWTRFSPTTSILKGGMDGSNPEILIPGLTNPLGIVIDFEESRLYWTEFNDNRIQSSNLQGGDIITVVQLSGSGLYGIALAKDRIFWGNYVDRFLQSSSKTGEDVRTLAVQDYYIRHITLVPDLTLPRNRPNHCERHECSKVCVLTATSFRCVD